jgi:glycosyltransferase involved in cell wall biosynthesis
VLDEHDKVGLSFARAAVVAHPVAAGAGPVGERPRRVPGVPSTFGYLGRLDDTKGVELLLAAQRPSGLRLLLAGEGERTYVERLRARSGAGVEWLGWVRPEQLLQQIDVLVVPSAWREPFGLVVVEAARAGVPVLAADQPGLVEAAQASGARYTTFSAGDAAALGTALRLSTAEYRVRPRQVEAVDLVQLIGQAARRSA